MDAGEDTMLRDQLGSLVRSAVISRPSRGGAAIRAWEVLEQRLRIAVRAADDRAAGTPLLQELPRDERRQVARQLVHRQHEDLS